MTTTAPRATSPRTTTRTSPASMTTTTASAATRVGLVRQCRLKKRYLLGRWISYQLVTVHMRRIYRGHHFFYRLCICFNDEDIMIGCPFSNCSITGLRLHNALLFLKVANPSASTVDTCKYYDCSYRYEHKRDYEDIVCEDECDDRECCDRKRECDQYHVVYSKTNIYSSTIYYVDLIFMLSRRLYLS